LIISSEEKDNLIIKLKSKLIEKETSTKNNFFNNNQESIQEVIEKELNSSLKDLSSEDQRDQTKQRKIEGLLKLICEKNNQIDLLKTEINKIKNCSTQNLNTSLSSNEYNSNNKVCENLEQQNLNILLDCLDKEIQIYKKLNQNDSIHKENLQEIIKLRNQLLKATIVRDNHNFIDFAPLKNRFVSASNENLLKTTNSEHSMLGDSQRSNADKINWRKDSDSGLNSQKSDSSVNSASEQKNDKKVISVRASSIPRPVNPNQIKDDFKYKNYSREELINFVEKILNENSILKRQIECENFSLFYQ
jgi:hypothetical protein